MPVSRRPADDPRRLAESVLDLALILSRANCGAVFSSETNTAGLVASIGLYHEALATSMAFWPAAQPELARGEVIYKPGFLLMPVISKERILGYMHLDGPDPAFRFTSKQVDTFSDLLLRAVEAVTFSSGHPGPILGLGWTLETERARLLAVCEQEEWNIARVARIYGKERQTIYNWLRRLGIDRKRVPKAP